MERKIGVTERSRSLNPRKGVVMTIIPIIVHFNTKRARSMHVNFVRSKETSLIAYLLLAFIFCNVH